MKKTILVTGGAGYIGSIACELLKKDYELVIIDDLSTGFYEALPADCVFYQGSVLDQPFLSTVFAKHKFTAIIHFAAKLIVPESLQQPLNYYETNILGLINLLKLCLTYKVNRFIFSSTAAVYGTPEISPVKESSEKNPLNPYGYSKLMCERILTDYSKIHSDFKFVALRYFNVAGADINNNHGLRTKNATHLVQVCIEAALGLREEVQVFGTDFTTKDGTGVRDYVHVLDLVSAHAAALNYLERSNSTNQILNCGYGIGYSVEDVIKKIKNLSQVDFKVTYAGRRPGDSAEVIADNSAIFKYLNWVPKYNTLEKICDSSLKWTQFYNSKLKNK